jgi:hypothetical protein
MIAIATMTEMTDSIAMIEATEMIAIAATIEMIAMTTVRHPARKDAAPNVLFRKRPRGSQNALLRQNALILTVQGMAGEEQKSSLALIEPRVDTRHMLLQRLRHHTGRPGESQ